LSEIIDSTVLKDRISDFFSATELFDIDDIKTIIVRAYEIFSNQMKIVHLAVILVNDEINYSETFLSEDEDFFLKNIQRFEENGIMDWSSSKTELLVLPDWENPKKENNSYTIFNMTVNKSFNAIFIAEIKKPADLIKDREKSIISYFAKFLLTICVNKLLALENVKLRKKLTYLNKKVIHQARNSTFGQISAESISNVLTYISAVEAHFRFIDSGLGDINQRYKTIKNNFISIKDELRSLLTIKEDSNSSKLEIIDLKKIVENFSSIAKSYLDKNNIKLIIEIDDKSLFVLANSALLYYIFFNLMLNSVDSMPDGGKFTLGIYRNKNNIDILAVDTGIGIDEEEIKTIFQPFAGDNEITGKTGVSLYIIKNIVKQYGGVINIISQQREGTTVKIILPEHE